METAQITSRSSVFSHRRPRPCEDMKIVADSPDPPDGAAKQAYAMQSTPLHVAQVDASNTPTTRPDISQADMDRLAEVLCRVLLSWWQRKQTAGDSTLELKQQRAA